MRVSCAHLFGPHRIEGDGAMENSVSRAGKDIEHA